MAMSTPQMTMPNTAVLSARRTLILYASWPGTLVAETLKPDRWSMSLTGMSSGGFVVSPPRKSCTLVYSRRLGWAADSHTQNEVFLETVGDRIQQRGSGRNGQVGNDRAVNVAILWVTTSALSLRVPGATPSTVSS